MSSPFFAYLSNEAKIFLGFCRAISRKSIPSPPTYTVVNGDKYSLLVPMLIIVAIFDVPIMALIAMSIVKNIHVRHWIDGILALGTLYGIMWVVGDGRAIKESGHTVASDALRLHLGLRCSGSVDVALLGRCQEISGNFKSYCAENKLPADQIWKISPIDSPNVMIELKEISAIEVVRFGTRRSVQIKYIALYVDQMRQFVHDVGAAISDQ
jgi:hypothetical protein